MLLTFWSSQDILTANFLDQVKVPFMVLKEWLNWTGSSSSIEEPTFMMPGKRDERHIYRRFRRVPCGIPGLGISLVNVMNACDHIIIVITRAYP